MDRLNSIQLSTYYKEISSVAVCTAKQKKHFVSELKSTVNEYIEMNPDCTIDDIKAVFGTPEEISLSFIENGNFSKVKKKLDTKRVLLIAVLIALIIWFSFAVISLIDVHTEAHGTLNEGLLLINTITEVSL